jgi:hypothetical protein
MQFSFFFSENFIECAEKCRSFQFQRGKIVTKQKYADAEFYRPEKQNNFFAEF